MGDLLFPLIIVGFFALVALLVRACDLLVGPNGRRPSVGRLVVSVGDVIGLVLAVAALAYLFWALLFPERL